METLTFDTTYEDEHLNDDEEATEIEENSVHIPFVEHSNTVKLSDVKKATDFAKDGEAPEEYYRLRREGIIKLSDELEEDERLQWTRPQVIITGGLQRSGKSTVTQTIAREFTVEGIPCFTFSSDTIRKGIVEEVEQELEEGMSNGKYKFAKGTEEYANVRENMIYSPENQKRAYEMLYAAAGKAMKEQGAIVIVDATHITDEKRAFAREKISQAYNQAKAPEDDVVNIPQDAEELKWTYVEVSNAIADAEKIFEEDKERIAKLRRGENTKEIKQQSVTKPKSPYYLPYDVSEAKPDIRRRDEAKYQPIHEEHIKIVNHFSNVDQLIEHVRRDMFAQKPENLYEQNVSPTDVNEIEEYQG